jgi:predicted RND superfamily exporter protein
VVRWHKMLAVGSGTLALILIAFIPTLEFNDTFTKYFDDRVAFRRAVDASEPYFGAAPIEISLPASEPGGVSNPEYLQTLDAFTKFLRGHGMVRHVYSITDIMKRLNRNMHGDDPNEYALPGDRELAAQYLLLYELSLPYGLDLNDRINIDKSASRITVNLDNPTTVETKAFLSDADAWLQENAPEYMREVEPTGAYVMFTFITDRNVESMIEGTLIAIAVIGLILIFALSSVGLGLLSLIPNGLPIMAALGAWAVISGEVGFTVAVVASLSLGIVVDDTVHFLTKYRRARVAHGSSKEDAIRYAFVRVGPALIINTVILAAGFAVLVVSSFKLTADMGLLTMLAIIFALLFDFLLLPGLLLWFGDKDQADAPAS